MSSARQLRALGLLVWRSITRLALRGGTPQVGLGAAATRLMLITLFVASITFNFGRASYQIGQLPRGRIAPTGVFLDALFFFGLAMAAGIELAPTLKRRSGTLGDPGMLDPLPLFFVAKMGLVIAQSAIFLALAIPSALCLAGTRSPEEWPALAVIATALGLALTLLSTLVCRALRVVLPAHRARRALQALTGAATIAALAAFLLAVPTRSAWVRAVRSDLATALPLFKPVTKLLAARPESSYGSAFLQLGLMGGLALALLWLSIGH
jgi:hypothetical protein